MLRAAAYTETLMRLVRGIGAVLVCALLLPVAAPCAAWATSRSPLPCCGAPAKSSSCAGAALQAPRDGCCSKAQGEAQRVPAGIDREAGPHLWAAVPAPPVVTGTLARKATARPALPSTQHDILRL